MDLGGVMAAPPYPTLHSGPCIVAGNAACLSGDLSRARTVLGEVPVIAVNGAARHVKAIALVSQHPERMVQHGFEWIARQGRKFGPGFTVHAPGEPQAGIAHVDHWWPDLKRAGGSAWFGRKVAKLIGFSPVVLCGCPLTVGPYVGNHNIGGFMHRDDVVADLRNGIMLDVEWHEGAYSMSGWTRELLGEVE